MRKCVKCGKKGLFLQLDAQKHCANCSFISFLEAKERVATVENMVAAVERTVKGLEQKVTAVEQVVKQLEQKVVYIEKSIRLNMKNWVVENEYKTVGLNGYRFEWKGCVYSIENAPYQLIIKATNGDVYCTLNVDSYYDCGILIGDVFFWGERLGKISGYSLSDKKICFCSYINEDAEKFYKEQASIYPFSFPPKSGSYDFLPEINHANYVVSKLAITTQTSYRHYLIAGDLSGRVSVFDVNTLQLVKTFAVDGAVAGIKMDDEKIAIDYIKSGNLYSPESLIQHKEALQTHIEITL